MPCGTSLASSRRSVARASTVSHVVRNQLGPDRRGLLLRASRAAWRAARPSHGRSSTRRGSSSPPATRSTADRSGASFPVSSFGQRAISVGCQMTVSLGCQGRWSTLILACSVPGAAWSLAARSRIRRLSAGTEWPGILNSTFPLTVTGCGTASASTRRTRTSRSPPGMATAMISGIASGMSACRLLATASCSAFGTPTIRSSPVASLSFTPTRTTPPSVLPSAATASATLPLLSFSLASNVSDSENRLDPSALSTKDLTSS